MSEGISEHKGHLVGEGHRKKLRLFSDENGSFRGEFRAGTSSYTLKYMNWISKISKT